MKKIFYSMAVAALALSFSSCKETWDENPVLVGHEGVQTVNFLNEPVLKDQPVMITNDNSTGTFHLTCSQPYYGYAAVATYKVQVSLSEDFNDFIELSQAFYDCSNINPVNADIAAAIEKLSGVQSEDDLPMPYQTMYVRLHSQIDQSPENTEYLSNVVSFNQVSADYLAIWVSGVPVNMYVRGGLPLASDWSPIPEYQFVTGPEENTWVISYLEMAAGTEFKIADASWGSCNWGAGDAPLVIGEEYMLNTGNNPGNIQCPADFAGSVQVRMEKGNYYLLLDPKAE
ncbi:MAG: hypothetical protein HDS79_02390 [Bacteroidales bacterium]|nr:hypothetical protein [Bacteroidales bacterium]MDE7465794.1 hypothetical protein [Muribaculaceae bacterium]